MTRKARQTRIVTTAAAATLAASVGLTAAACGGGPSTSSPTTTSSPSTVTPSSPTASPGPATPVPSASASAALERFKQVATGPLAAKVQADLATFAKDAAKPDLAAAETDARRVATDITAWANALRSISLPPAYQAAKTHLLQGMDKMSTGVTTVANGIHNRDTTVINQGNAEIQSGVTLIRKAQTEIPR